MSSDVERSRVSLQEAQRSFSPFAREFISSANTLIANPRYWSTLSQFQEAYKYRRGFPSLGESGQLPDIENGLTYALEYALALYGSSVDQLEGAEEPCQLGDVGIFAIKLKPAIIEVAGDKWLMKRFARDIGRRMNWGTNIDEAEAVVSAHIGGQTSGDIFAKPSDVLVPHLGEALDKYWVRHRNATSGLPW